MLFPSFSLHSRRFFYHSFAYIFRVCVCFSSTKSHLKIRKVFTFIAENYAGYARVQELSSIAAARVCAMHSTQTGCNISTRTGNKIKRLKVKTTRSMGGWHGVMWRGVAHTHTSKSSKNFKVNAPPLISFYFICLVLKHHC